jgi:hypothetical protein
MSHAYRLSALKLLSDIELPELLPWDGGCEAPADLYFRLGRVPDELAPGGDCARYMTVFPDEARVLVENGSSVTLELAAGADLTEARAILMAPVQAVLWHQRGLLPLHASVVAKDGKAVALAGPSGSGKSTLAAVLSSVGGCDVLADDIAIIDPADAVVLPGTRRLRLWRDALDYLGIGVDELPRALSRREKYLIEAGADDGSDRRRLSAVVLLTRESGGPVAVERLRGAQAVIALQGIVHMSEAARALGREPTIFTALTGLVAGGLSVWQLMLPDDRTYLDDAAAQVLALLSAG